MGWTERAAKAAAKATVKGAAKVSKIEGRSKSWSHSGAFTMKQVRCVRCRRHPGKQNSSRHSPKCGNCQSGWTTVNG